MGLSIDIVLELPIDASTGAPAAFTTITVIPQRFLRFVHHKGPHLSRYLPPDIEQLRASPHDLLSAFPMWNEVAESVSLEHYAWREADHDLFREALVWLSDHTHYTIHWSY
jgi:hypothetical protein